MQISRIQPAFITNRYNLQQRESKITNNETSLNSNPFKSIPYTYKYNANITFGEYFDPNRTIPHIDYEEYVAMKPHTKTRFRRKYTNFVNDKSIDKSELVDDKYKYLPLQSERSMDAFIKVAKIYSKYKDQPIICLGRSPKWFLNASLWMKDGIDDYKFVAFSKFWYRKDNIEGIRRLNSVAPTEDEAAAYKKYLKRIKADPLSIVKHFEKTGKKTVITDYINTGKGVSSFLDIMSKFAEEDGILEEFANSIQIVGIGSLKYMENFVYDDEDISIPKVYMPDRLLKYDRAIKQEYYDMDYEVFEEMLINQNTNECRSTYYPHNAWTIYKPDQFKTGLIKDMKKVGGMIIKMKKDGEKCMSSFTPAMYDYRNLLNFRILDGLYKRGLLKTEHKSKV